MTASMHIGQHQIHDASRAFVIAEVGHNHQGRMESAMELVRQAHLAGASAVKLQKRDNEQLYTREFFNSPYNSPNSYGATYGEHRELLEFGRSQYQELMAYSKELGIVFFATAHDQPSADFLADLDLPAYKIASADLKNLPLIRQIAHYGKPMLLSTGGGSLDEVQRAYDEIMPINPQLCILQCTSAYPCQPEQLNLRVISTFRQQFPDVVAGFSAHDMGFESSIAAYTLGARVFEKHFTLDRTLKGTDQAFSLEPADLAELVGQLDNTYRMLGSGDKYRLECERPALLKMEKKLVAARPLPAGHVLQRTDLAIKSPGGGISPSDLEEVLGCELKRSLAEEEALQWEDCQRQTALRIATPQTSLTLEERIADLRMLVFDFDGVFTDNSVYVSEDGTESVRCSRGDGFGLRMLEELGIELLILSTERNPVVSHRANKLQVACIQNCDDKRLAMEAILLTKGLTWSQVGFVGNDINDACCLEMVGLPIVVNDAVPSVVEYAAYQTRADGGKGAVREVCEMIRQVRLQVAAPARAEVAA